MIIVIKSCNSILSSFIAKLNIGSLRRLRYIKVNYSKIAIDITKLLYKEGILRLYTLRKKKIYIYFKYIKGCNLFKFKIISKPSKRIYWSLSKLSLNYNKENFTGLYIISTNNGLYSSTECLLIKHISGEILFKVFI